MRIKVRRIVALGTCTLVALFCELVLAQIRSPYDLPGRAVVEKPKRHAFGSGSCVRVTDGSFLGEWFNRDGTLLKVSIGPTGMGLIDDVTPRNKAPYTGPGQYKDVLVKFSLGGRPGNLVVGHSTVTVNPDGQTGRFDFNDGSAAGTWDCGKDSKTNLEGNRGTVASPPGGERWVLICTPQYQETPDIKRAMDDGTFQAHWDLVDRRLNQIKDDKAGALYKPLSAGKDTWVLWISSYHDQEKLAHMESMTNAEARCPANHLKRRYRFQEWVTSRGMAPKGLQSF